MASARAAMNRGDGKMALIPLQLLSEESSMNGDFRLPLARAGFLAEDITHAESAPSEC